jgi:CheY-like chemotaxis protein
MRPARPARPDESSSARTVVADDKAAAADLQALREANRRKDEFISMLSHELRNPLGPILTVVELLKMRGRSKELDIIERQATQMVRLVDDLLDATSIAQGRIKIQKSWLSVKDVITKAIETASPHIEEKEHCLHVRVDPRRLLFFGDEARMVQAVGNLLTNAAKYTPRCGNIAVRAWGDERVVLIEVRDDGQGIDETLLPYVFDLFIQAPQAANRPRGGLGIGLAIVRSLVELHGGQVEAKSNGPGRGSKFLIRLPIVEEPVNEAVSIRPIENTRSPKRILLVEDNADALEAMADLLREIGHEVHTAVDAPTALDKLRTFPAELAILDIGLPGMDGYKLAARVRASHGARAPRLIALTGYGQAADRSRSKAAGFVEHLTKPVCIATLVDTIEAKPKAG